MSGTGRLMLEINDTAVVELPGRTDGAKGKTTLRLDLDRITEMIAVIREPDDEWLGEISHEEWALWDDLTRKGVLSDMLTWPPCNRSDGPVVPNDAAAIASLAAYAKAVMS